MTNRILIILSFFLMTMYFSYGQTTDSSLTQTNSKTFNKKDQADSATVYISFIIETSGKITNVKVTKIKCRKCSKVFKESLKSEAIRVIKSMPDFEPRKERIRYIQPMKFVLTDE